MIEISSGELEDLLVCSFRYALGRRSYVSGTIANLLIKYKNNLTKRQQYQICAEINEAIPDGRAGMQMDIHEWIRVTEEFNI